MASYSITPKLCDKYLIAKKTNRHYHQLVNPQRRKIKIIKNKRRNFFPLLIAVVISWLTFIFVIYFVDPYSFAAVPIFLSILFISLLLTISTIMADSKKGVIYAMSLTLFAILRYFGIGNIINLILIIGVGVAIDLFLNK